MRDWRDHLLRSFQPPLSPLYVAVDPDGLLLDERIAAVLKQMEIEMTSFDDPVEFRYVYETHFRLAIEDGSTRLIIRTVDEQSMPYDLVQRGQLIRFHVADLFPNMSASVVRQLDTYAWDRLYDVYEKYGGTLSAKDTLDFLLRHVYKLPYDTMDTLPDLYKWFLSLHARAAPLPEVVEQFLIEQLQEKEAFRSLPIARWVRTPEVFYASLQHEWTHYVQQAILCNGVAKDQNEAYHIKGASHPFDDPDVRRMMNDLFVEGHLQPVEGFHGKSLPAWAQAGVVHDPIRDRRKRLEAQLAQLKKRAGQPHKHDDWCETARLFGEAKAFFLEHQGDINGHLAYVVGQIEAELDRAFVQWMTDAYSGLSSLPPVPQPVMVHHIPHYLASEIHPKVALVVLDGMSVVQWSFIKHLLRKRGLLFRESGVFAWVPTLTSVSRQAMFAGQIPLYFADSLWSTDKEERLWRRFWEKRGIPRPYITYERNLGRETYDRRHIAALNQPKVKVAGLVLNTIDEFTHRALQGHAGIHAELALWMKQDYLVKLLHDLDEAGFSVFLTSDHGNKACRGIGPVSDGVLVETKGERVRMYRDPELYKERVEQFDTVRWSNVGLPRDVYPLMARENEAFIRKGDYVVSHGGMSIEEVVVPFAQLAEMGSTAE